ncbi:hypothetical protein ONS95_010708 [Cadophora gregata]|uniref:uncharacterized protein n=1 Tax=Cadophora gregata TaxID=51156 RepID=UPI0026DBCC57|nr:uncharacterized protein ONS95_010708 [Cadophora gregata]KAK0122476.1 hypothetical protein ONS95_010708 [Cadophora gregata]KAK0127953.1 hypothetical protein ONS96_007451 [Cadophora gregata f. sp. sojae]
MFYNKCRRLMSPYIQAHVDARQDSVALLRHCMSFFNMQLQLSSSDFGKADSPTSGISRFTSLPLELQLDVIDQMSLYEADKAVRRNFPHLIPRWIPTIPTRFERWLHDLTSLENMRFLSCDILWWQTHDRDIPQSYYRLQSPNFHPDVEIHPRLFKSEHPSKETLTYSVKYAKKHLILGLLALYDLYRSTEQERMKISMNNRIPTYDCLSWDACEKCGGPDIPVYALPLTSNPSQPSESIPMPPQVIIFRDELHEIFRTFEVATRPLVFETRILRDAMDLPQVWAEHFRPYLKDYLWTAATSPEEVGYMTSLDLREPGRLIWVDYENRRAVERLNRPDITQLGPIYRLFRAAREIASVVLGFIFRILDL